MPSSRKRNQRKNRPNRNLNFETLEPRRLLTVNGPGISDPALFDIVFNVAAETTSTSSLAENGFLTVLPFGSTTVQQNVAEGGIVGNFVRAFFGFEVNISGGEVGRSFEAESGSEVNISGGEVGPFFVAESGSVVNISGGEIGDGFGARAGSEVNLFVESFEIDGVPQIVPANGESITITNRDVTLSGRFTDNTAFSFDLNRTTTEFSFSIGETDDIVIDDVLTRQLFSPDATLTVTLVESVVQGGPNIVGSDGDDEIEATGEDGTLVGGTGSDILIGSTGNDVFTTDLINGDKDRNDQDVIRLGNVDGNDTGNDVITDFDVNRNNRSENNFDTLEFTFQGINHSLSSRNDILNFVAFIESDGDVNTDAIVEGNDLILIFGRDSENPDMITSSIRLVDVVGQNGLSFDRLRSNSVDELGEFQDDIFSAAGNVDIGSDVGETLEGSSENDNIIGGLGSDTLVGGGGNDTLTGDENLGDNNQFDQDIFVLGDVSAGGSGNDVITDFDTNNANGGEDNFDTLEVSIGDQQFALDTGNEFLTFANLLESDGNDGTGTLIDGDDLIFVFSRNADGVITDSVRLEDIIGDDGLTDAALAAFDRIGESDGIDIFV